MDDEAVRKLLEQIRWPNGAICPKCGVESPYKIRRRTQTKNVLSSLYKCRSCRKQFTPTVGTIFQDSHIPLSIWFDGIDLICGSQRALYTDWRAHYRLAAKLALHHTSGRLMVRRLREAMLANDPLVSGLLVRLGDYDEYDARRKDGQVISHTGQHGPECKACVEVRMLQAEIEERNEGE